MLEQELKLHVPKASRSALVAQLKSLSGEARVRMRAMYFDTADRQLARQRAAIRLRLEGRKWVQTFKMAGGDALSRIEINHPRPGPELDLSVYAGTPAEAVFARVDGELVLRYETDVWRLRRLVRSRLGLVEVAYDEGLVRAQGLELPLSEIEFELMSGRVGAMFTVGARWLKQHKLVLDVRSKAERGDGLANAATRIADASLETRQAVRDEEIARFWAPTMASKLTLAPRATPQEALDAITAECLEQVIRNAAGLAGVDAAMPGTVGGAEHVHQLRVGMRRLRSAWRLFGDVATLPEPEVQQRTARYFGEFGEARDSDVLGATVVPQLRAAGMPAMDMPPAAQAPDANRLAASPAFQGWLLDLLAWNVGVRPAAAPLLAPMDDAPTPKPEKLVYPVSRRLRKWHKKLVRDGKRFLDLEDETRHKLRKLAKRLRYGLTFTESLFDEKRVKPYRKRLSSLQDVLGDINDLVVARDVYAGMTDTHPQAWFAIGWITSRLDQMYEQARQQFEHLAKVPAFWK